MRQLFPLPYQTTDRLLGHANFSRDLIIIMTAFYFRVSEGFVFHPFIHTRPYTSYNYVAGSLIPGGGAPATCVTPWEFQVPAAPPPALISSILPRHVPRTLMVLAVRQKEGC